MRLGAGWSPNVIITEVSRPLLSKVQCGTPCGFSRSASNKPTRRKPWLGEGPPWFPHLIRNKVVSIFDGTDLPVTIVTGIHGNQE